MKITYNKLIRDNIPEIIETSNKTCITETLSDNEYIVKLKEKVIEEAHEVFNASEDEIIGELADILELIEAIEEYYHLSHDDVLRYKEKKAETNGKFKKRLLLKEVHQ